MVRRAIPARAGAGRGVAGIHLAVVSGGGGADGTSRAGGTASLRRARPNRARGVAVSSPPRRRHRAASDRGGAARPGEPVPRKEPLLRAARALSSTLPARTDLHLHSGGSLVEPAGDPARALSLRRRRRLFLVSRPRSSLERRPYRAGASRRTAAPAPHRKTVRRRRPSTRASGKGIHELATMTTGVKTTSRSSRSTGSECLRPLPVGVIT